MVTTPGTGVSFISCEFFNSDGLQQFQWLVNGTRLEDLNRSDKVDGYVSHRTGVIIFLNVSAEYNGTTIQCIANFTSEEIVYSSPFKLGVDPDITGYCVGVVTSTSSLKNSRAGETGMKNVFWRAIV